jgi:hypothetical protein
MTQEEFEKRLQEMFMPSTDDPDYRRKEAEAENLIKPPIHDTTRFAGGTWKDDAAERFKQWECFYSQTQNPAPIVVPATNALSDEYADLKTLDYNKSRFNRKSKLNL